MGKTQNPKPVNLVSRPGSLSWDPQLIIIMMMMMAASISAELTMRQA